MEPINDSPSMPVNEKIVQISWHEWSEEAFKKARKENKPVMLNISAKWCHFCHIMEKECFEDAEIAGFINENFIPIKADKDKRPDIDRIYQKKLELIAEQSGWPLIAFLTYEKNMFFGGTYFPKNAKNETKGFLEILKNIADDYKNNSKPIEKTARQATDFIKEFSKTTKHEGNYDKNIILRVVEYLIDHTDHKYGGFGYLPKFPQTESLKLILNDHIVRKNEKASKALRATLYGMANGGFYDQLGGGFHRYSLDQYWKVPHFEKMLSDNAMLLDVYISAYKISKNKFYLNIIEETLNFMAKELFDEKGYFYSSIDSDTDRKEGGFYVWKTGELKDALIPEEFKVFGSYYGIQKDAESDFKNVLYVAKELADIANEFEMNIDKAKELLEGAKEKVLAKREERPKPAKDISCYTNMNSLAISAFVKAYKLTRDEKYLHMAKQAAGFILRNLYYDRVLYHLYDGEKHEIEGFLDDYAYLAQAMLDIYEATFEEKYLKHAINLCTDALIIFQSDIGALYYADKKNDEIINEIPVLDKMLPSPNSIMGINFTRLYYLTYDEKYLETADKILRSIFKLAEGDFISCSTYYYALYRLLNEPQLNIIVGSPAEEEVTEFMFKLSEKPNLNMINLINDGSREHTLFDGKIKKDDRVTVYICKDKVCMEPLTDPRELEAIEGPGLINVR